MQFIQTPEKPTILYVDDEQSNLTAFTAAFRRDFNILTTTSPREAIDILSRESHVHLVITDQRMPEMTGVQFLEAIIPDYPNPIRMILTGFSDVEAIIKAINTGRVFRYITKPWDPSELRQILDNAFKIYKLEEQNRTLVAKLQEEINNQSRILNLFQKYVPENIVQEALASHEEDSLLSGEIRIVTVLISDIRGFTTIASKVDPKITVEVLNNYFTMMNDCIKRHRGSLNKYLGDGILAIFGAPVSYINNADNAVMCAKEMIDLLEGFNEKYASLTGGPLKIGIGINSGEVTVGNMGSSDRLEYGIIGDTVNITSRIEEMTHSIPNGILISEATNKSLTRPFSTEDLGCHPIRGKSQEIRIYRVL